MSRCLCVRRPFTFMIVALFAIPGIGSAGNALAADEKSDRAWHTAWNEQKGLFVWPTGYSEKQLDIVKDFKFGVDVPNRSGVREQLIEHALADYKKLVEAVMPLAWRDDWTRTLRLPPANVRLPTSEEVWLMLEDLWLQRELVEVVNRVNTAAARFKRVMPKGIDDPKHRVFRSPIWEVNLRIIDKDGKATLSGSLTNITDRLQVLGQDNSMKLNVWLSADATQPFAFEVESPTVEAGKTLLIKQVDRHMIPADMRASQITRVEQVFDLRTAPVKRIEYLVLGKVGERQHKEPLVMSKYSERIVGLEKAKEESKTVNGIERRRYLKATEHARQMPFGLVVLADPACMKDLLDEVSRSRMRFQITQSEWSRFHGELTFAIPAQPKGPAPKEDGPANNREDRHSAGLVELSIYGIATLYENYPADKPAPKADPDSDKKPTVPIDSSWLRIHELINHSLPMPGEKGNMSGADQRKWWDFATEKQDGRRAAEKYFARRRQGVDPRLAVGDDDLRDCLATVDIEAVHNRYVTNLKGLYENAADYQKRFVSPKEEDWFAGMNADELKKMPEGEGWVFEIRGTTWYDGPGSKTKEFILATLVSNLKRLANDPKSPPDLKGKISHVFLYNVWRDNEARPATFRFIHASLIDNLIPAPWRDIEPRPATFRFIHTSLIDNLIPAPMEEGVGGNFLPLGMPSAYGSGAEPKVLKPKPAAKARARSEFVIVFVWKEPPSTGQSTSKLPEEKPKPWAPFFDPIDPPDTRRLNPVVLPITEIQADFMWAKIAAFDIREVGGKQLIGVINSDPAEKNDPPRPRIDYVPFEAQKLEGKRLAITIYPQRMVILNAAFPYKEQMVEIARSLRLEKVADIFTEAPPRFHGFVVERRIVMRDGKPGKWQSVPVEESYKKTIYPRSLGDHDDAELRYVIAPPEHALTMLLPDLSPLNGRYPDVRLPSILRAIQKLRETGKPPGTPVFPKGSELPDHILVRIVDNDVLPGSQYQYRIKVRLQNPNWVGVKPDKARYDLVRRRADADVEIIDGPFVEMKETIRIPVEEYLYAIDPPLPDPKDPKNAIQLKSGEALLQIQRWVSVATIGGYREPVGDWIVADLVARRGTYLGGRQWIPIPIWSSEFNRYLHREMPAEKGSKLIRRGIDMDPTVGGPRLVVADIQGGRQRLRTNLRTIEDESVVEVLLVDEDGRMQVRSSHVDSANPERARREETWRAWVEKVEKETPGISKPKTFDPFK